MALATRKRCSIPGGHEIYSQTVQIDTGAHQARYSMDET